VCQGTYDTKSAWLGHLLEPSSHQSKARKDIGHWDKKDKKSTLLLFTSFPIACLEVLTFFSKGSSDVVTNFVWFEDFSRKGFLQFESK